MNDVTLETFPSNEIEALAMLFVQRQDLSKATSRDLLDMYEDAYNQIYKYAREKENNASKWF